MIDPEPPCARLAPDLVARVFFGENGHQTGRYRADDVEFARHLCGTCPLRQECLDEALRIPQTQDHHGIRAGLLPAERKALRARYKITVKDTGDEWRGGPLNTRRRDTPVTPNGR